MPPADFPFKYADTHGHPNFVAFDHDRDEVVKRALDNGVMVLAVGTQGQTSRKAVELAEKYERGVYAAIGLHPIHTAKSFHDEKELGEGGREFTSRGEQFDYDFYKTLGQSGKVVAIGECGLDYYHLEEELSGVVPKKQEENFRKQIELAIEVQKPLMLHLRNGFGRSAYNDAYKILATYGKQPSAGLRGNLHFFAGSVDEARQFLDLGFSFSFTGVVTFAANYNEILNYLPLDRIMTETDCPYVSPAPYRGKRNEPLYVKEVVRAIAAIRGEDLEKARSVLFNNAVRFFGLSER
jgi:TatD DNase family protein